MEKKSKAHMTLPRYWSRKENKRRAAEPSTEWTGLDDESANRKL